MNEDIVKSLNLEMENIIKGKYTPEERYKAAEELKDKADTLLNRGSNDLARLQVACYEVMGNMKVQLRQPAEAEKLYKQMREKAELIFKKAPSKYDLTMAQVNLRMGIFYQTYLGMNGVVGKPKELTEQQGKLVKLITALYSDCLKMLSNKVKAGQLKAIDTQSKCMSKLMLLYAAQGKYEQSIKTGDDLVHIEKQVFQQTDDAHHALTLSQDMNYLASIYSINKNNNKAMELIEDSIYVLEDKEEQAPLVFALPIAAAWISLGNVYKVLPEEKEKAPEAHEKGLKKFEWLNAQTNGQYKAQEEQVRKMLGRQ